MSFDLILRNVASDIILSDCDVPDAPAATVITLCPVNPLPAVNWSNFTIVLSNTSGSDITLRDSAIPALADYTLKICTEGEAVIVSFPVQFSGLRYFSGTVKELCLVATADAPIPVWRVRKGSTTYAVYLVDTSDPNASGVRVKTAAGIKAARLKT